MKLSDISIHRPVFATVMSLTILLFGIISFTQLPVREPPDIDPPIISVVPLYRGASSNVVETEISDVLEEQFATLEGVKTITSSSREGGSVITIEFELNQNVNEAANDVRDRVSRVRGTLPQEIEDPIISKVDANAQAIVWLALSSTHHSGLELSDFADRVLKERIQRMPGVGSVIIGGEREFAVRTRGDLTEPEEFGAIIVLQKGNDIIRLRDVADVNVGAEDERTMARWNGQLAVGLGIVKKTKASTVDVAAEIHSVLPELSKLLPEGMKLEVAYDSSEFINESISEVQQTLIIALVLVVLVVLAFL